MKRRKNKEKVEEITPELVHHDDTYSPMNAMGVPKKYNSGMATKIFEMAKLCVTREEMARVLRVSLPALNQWIADKPECKKAYLDGRLIHEMGPREALLKRALGYTWEKTVTRSGVDSIGRTYEYTQTSTEVVLPDVAALKFWMENMDPDNWSSTQHLNINSNINIKQELDASTLSSSEREILESLARKRMNQNNEKK